jgi:hypothetical protein
MSSQDLATIGPVALTQDLVVAGSLGITHSERNGHPYFRRLSMQPRDLQATICRAHPDLYEMEPGNPATLRCERGKIGLRSLNASPSVMVLRSNLLYLEASTIGRAHLSSRPKSEGRFLVYRVWNRMEENKRKQWSRWLTVAMVVAMIMGPGPGLRLVNPGLNDPIESYFFLGLPVIYAWGILWFVVQLVIVILAYIMVWSAEKEPTSSN